MAPPNSKFAYLPTTRVHVNAGWKWAHEVGTDYWLHPTSGLDQAAAASTALGPLLAENGWVATSLVNTNASIADFRGGAFTPGTGKNRDGSFADTGIPSHFLTNANADLLSSPIMFGNADGMQAASEIAGMRNLPNILGVSFWGAMTVHSANELDSGWGFVEDGGSPATAGDALAFIYTDGSNFSIQSNGAIVGSAGAADDALWHYFRMEFDFNGFLTWWIDGALQERNSVTITADEWPAKFGFAAGTTNRPGLGLTHCYYDWGSGRSQ
jgi:hypothetical protein